MNDRWARRAGAIAMLCCRGARLGARTVPQKLAAGPRSTPASTTSTPSSASTPKQREIGLMFRTVDAGQRRHAVRLRAAGQQCFWMKNTLLPLSIAFLADDGTHRQHRRHEAADARQSHCSAKPVRFVLEMNQGWFAKRGIKPAPSSAARPFSQLQAAARRTRPVDAGFASAERLSRSSSRRSPSSRAVQERLDELRPRVAVVDVVGVLPDVDRQQRACRRWSAACRRRRC